MLFSFVMSVDGKTVAKGEGSAAMVYSFQKAFIESIGPGNTDTAGYFLELNNMLARKTGEYSGWETTSVDGKRFKFHSECMEGN